MPDNLEVMNSTKDFIDEEASASSGEDRLQIAFIEPIVYRDVNLTAFLPEIKLLFYSGTVENASLSYHLCRHPGFCNGDFYKNCSNMSIHLCEECDMGLAAVFFLYVLCLGVAITLGNILIIMVSWARKNKKKADKMDVWKSSLAVADMIAGENKLS